jgi:hypothetical protein
LNREKKVYAGFDNGVRPRDSIIFGHHRGPDKAKKDKLQKR